MSSLGREGTLKRFGVAEEEVLAVWRRRAAAPATIVGPATGEREAQFGYFAEDEDSEEEGW